MNKPLGIISKMRILTLFAAALSVFSASCAATSEPSRETANEPYRFLQYVPKNHATDSTQHFPVLIFLHGSGEIGTELEVVKNHGPPMLIAQGHDFPFIVISPQLDERGGWRISRLERTLLAATNSLRIDPSRIYLTGLSLGGYGTWSWAAARPKLFAAIAPVAGSGSVATACAIKHIPIWAFHGARDDVVSARGSSDMIGALERCGGHPRFTLYPNEGHWSWVPAYNDAALYDWFLAQSNAEGFAEFEKLRRN